MKTTRVTKKPVHIFTDGSGQRPDGKGSGIAWIQEDTGRRHVERIDGLTNNEAEYRAVISALEALDPTTEAEVFLDSQLVVCQHSGAWKLADPRLIELHSKVAAVIASKHLLVKLTWVPRNRNLAGKML
jgi:ribonuclease HI